MENTQNKNRKTTYWKNWEKQKATIMMNLKKLPKSTKKDKQIILNNIKSVIEIGLPEGLFDEETKKYYEGLVKKGKNEREI